MYRFFDRLNPIVFALVANFFRIVNYLRGKDCVFVFTDSRGFEISKPWNRRNPFSSYIGWLMRSYSCDVRVCPHDYTSLLDFLDTYAELCDRNGGRESFDAVILHCGIVDFAPRPESSYDAIYDSKAALIEKYLLSSIIGKKYRTPGPRYECENTYSFLNREALEEVVIPHLLEIPNLIYIGINRVLDDWDGTYWRKRPDNINDQMELDALLLDSIDRSVNMGLLENEEIKIYTSDNVHYTKQGFDFIGANLGRLLSAE